MDRENRQTELNDRTKQLLHGPLKNARAAALAALLVPLASVPAVATPSGPCDFYSGGLAASLFDPVPDLIGSDGRRVTTDDEALASKGRIVAGIAADGVSQILLRISGSFGSGVGEQITLTVLRNGTNPSTSADNDGSVSAVGTQCPGAGCQSNQVTVTTKCIGSTLLAFAVYRSPIDFPRSDADDSALVYRDVHLRIQSSFGEADVTVRIVRPPVALIHGLWGSRADWSTFAPLWYSASPDTRFKVQPLDYGNTPVTVVSSDPPLTLAALPKVRANSLGLKFNRGPALHQLIPLIEDFKNGANPGNIPVASVQADVVGHSMGGIVTRSMVLDEQFLSKTSFRQGVVHKLITIDTPHQGSALAARLLSPEEFDKCFQHSLGNIGQAVLTTAVVVGPNGTSVANGAVGDLVDVPLSAALQEIASGSAHPLPTAMILGIYRNWAWLDALECCNPLNFNASRFALQHWPTGCPDDPLAQLDSTGWRAMFGNQDSDGIVQRTSQVNDLTESGLLDGYNHSKGTTSLGFAPPSALDAGAPALTVIGLLNTPLTNGQVYKTINP